MFDEIVVSLITENFVLKALDFALENNVHSMKLSSFLEHVDQLKIDGDEEKADLILRRITEIKKFDEVKIK